ncbi:MAG: hypoxanthine phosphoribosyltransferase [Truepera sp.]|nr:hypoxanthine phosphoribosyltransferase [Truepera sp.]
MDDSFFIRGPGAVQLSAADIEERVRALGSEIHNDYRGETLHLICVLNGAFMFISDLVRALDTPLTIDFLSVSSYGSRTESSGEVRLTKDLDQSLKNKHVVLVEDIVDTGLTVQYLLNYLWGRNPLSLKVATLLSKPSRRVVEVPLDYVGFEIEDAFVYGYGLDVAHLYRNLPFVTSQKD